MSVYATPFSKRRKGNAPDKHQLVQQEAEAVQGISAEAEARLLELFDELRAAEAELAVLKKELAGAEERRGREYDRLCEHPLTEALGVADGALELRTVPLVITVHETHLGRRDKKRYQSGRWLIQLRLSDGRLRVSGADGQERVATMLHPHVYNRDLKDRGISANEICWGALAEDARRAAEARDYGTLLELVFLILQSCNAEDPVSYAALRDIARPLDE